MTVSPKDAVLELDAVTVRFGGLIAVDGISLTVEPGARWAVIGPNGAGKTTLFTTVAGERYPTSGRVRMFGRDVTRTPSHRRARRGLGRTYQVTNVFPRLTVVENVAVAAAAAAPGRLRFWWPGRPDGHADETLEQCGLASRRDHLAGELSHGEQRQLELAIALAARPRLLLLDEPAAGLSAAERVLIRDLVRALPEGMSVLLIEHDIDLALDLVDQVLCMDNGEPIATGTPAEIRANEHVQAVYLRTDGDGEAEH
ncbi:MAG: ATP-binding cassette domain-containing protein [Streptosporangiales bacterium]|nr:ATP-binding cassette domain-containing protein [Streptosporangiales bacterium]